MLGRIVEWASSLTYEHYAQSLLAPIGITRMRIGGSRLAEKAPGEVIYYDYPDAALVRSAFSQDTTTVPSTYALSIPSMDSHGGWIASAIDLLRFITAVDNRPTPPDILSKASLSNMIARPSPPWGTTEEPYYGMGWEVRNTPDNWWHTGALPGVGTEMVRAGNGFTWVLLFNFRAYRDDNNFFNDMDQLGWNALASVSTWPTNDLFGATLSHDAWKAQHFTNSELSDPQVSGDGADPDGDGLVNLVEYALGTDPKSANQTGRPAVTRVSVGGQDYLALGFRRLLLEQEVEYRVEASDDLVHWEAGPQSVGDSAVNSDGTLTVTYREESPLGAKPHRFLRLSVVRKNG